MKRRQYLFNNINEMVILLTLYLQCQQNDNSEEETSAEEGTHTRHQSLHQRQALGPRSVLHGCQFYLITPIYLGNFLFYHHGALS